MQWIVLSAGLVILWWVSCNARRPKRSPELLPALDDALSSYLTAIASRTKTRGRMRVPISKSLLSKLEKAISVLLSLSEDQLVPAARHLCLNGRFLQEEAAHLLMHQSELPKLPRCAAGQPRVCIFADELISHCTACLDLKLLEEAVNAWQAALPMTEDELQSLPFVLQRSLLTLLCDLAQKCVSDQQSSQAALHLQHLLRRGQNRKARKLFEDHRSHSAFQEKLFSMDAAHEWLMDWWDQQGVNAEIWLQKEHERQTLLSQWISNAITSLRTLSLIPWEHTLEQWSETHRILVSDPIYEDMDAQSRILYRQKIALLSRAAHTDEKSIAAAATALCHAAEKDALESHVGYYLLDEGLVSLIRHMPHMTLSLRMRMLQERHGCGIFRLFSWTVFAALLSIGWFLRLPVLCCIPFAVLMLYSLQLLALRIIKSRLQPSGIPRMRMDNLNENTQTLVVCPVLLQDTKQALHMVRQLSILHEANRDEHLHFLLLGDFQDSLSGTLSSDAEILIAASTAIEALCADTGHPFFYLQRERSHVPGERLHYGRERKRGSLQMLLQLIEGKPVSDSFAYTSVDPAFFKGKYRFVITLDEGVLLPPESVLHLVGAMLHPLAKRQKRGHRARGVSMIQPRMEASPHTLKNHLTSTLACARSTSVALLEQHWLGRGDFLGNGIIDPCAFLDATQRAIPDGLALEPHLIEGELGGCALADDIVLYREVPQTFNEFAKHLHRQVRGIWQLLPFVCPFIPSARRSRHQPLDLTARFKIWRFLLTSLLPVMRLLILIDAAAAGKSWLWLLAVLFPDILSFQNFSFAACRSWLCRFALLPCETLLRVDAILRTLYRLWFSHQHLMERTNHPHLARSSAKPPIFFWSVSAGTAVLFAFLCFLPSASFVCCLFSAVLWGAATLSLPFWEQEKNPARKPTRYMREVLLHIAQQTLTYFETVMTKDHHDLVPSQVQIDPNKGISNDTSPDSIGWYLLSLIALEKLHLLTAEEMAMRMRASLTALESLPLWHGLPFQKYDTASLQPFFPAVVSSAGCGILAVCLLTCAQGVRMRLEALPAEHHDLPGRIDRFVQQMSLNRLYDPQADLFWASYNVSEDIPSSEHHELLASNAYLLSFVAILLKQVPLKHWKRLKRQQTRSQALISPHGGLSEYLTPALFHPFTAGTLLNVSARAMLKMQYKHRLGGAFGISESDCYAFDADLHYLNGSFGLPALAIDPHSTDGVLAPYATLLSMTVHLKKAFHNLLRLQILGLEGPLGLFESADFDQFRTEGSKMRIVRSHRTDHQGMNLCAICNILENNYIVSLFSRLPRAEAYRMLTEEIPMQKRSPIRRALKLPKKEKATHMQQMQREARALHFPIDAHLLSGAGTSWLIDAQGGGSLICNDVPLTRFDPDCHVPSGMRLYMRDSQSGAYWILTDPYLAHSIQFASSQAVFSHTRFDISCQVRMWVNPLDGSAIHCVTLESLADTERMMEICSYLDLDCNQPIRSQRLGKCGICAGLPSSSADAEHRIWHLLHTETEWSMVRMQSDRSAFLGRGRSFHSPRALEFPISAVADYLGETAYPCISLRGQFVLPAHSTSTFYFITHLALPNEKSVSFLEKYASSKGISSTYEPAVTRSMVNSRFLNLTQAEETLISRMTGALCYQNQPFQGGKSILSPSVLASFGIDKNLPMLLLECCASVKRDLLSLLLKAHALNRLNGRPIELVIAAESSTHLHTLLDEIDSTIASSHCHDRQGIHIIQRPTDEEWMLLRSHARLALKCSASPEDQLDSLTQNVQARPLFTSRSTSQWKMELPPVEKVLFFNGYGGFTPVEENYQITLPPGVQTPQAWHLPLFQAHFGTVASESGIVSNIWNGNDLKSIHDVLSPYCDEGFYLRDQENRLLWSLTRHPIGHGMPVRITYAPGEVVYECSAFGVYGRALCFTDSEKPLGMRVIQLRNEDQVERSLTLVHSCLFPCFLQCGNDFIHGYDPQGSCWIGLAAADPAEANLSSMSAGGFHGLWNNAPYALSCMEHFPQHPGNMGLLSWSFVLKPGESRTFTAVIGTGSSLEELKSLVENIRIQGSSQRLQLLRQQWSDRLGALQFDLPDRSLAVLLHRWLPYQAWSSALFQRFTRHSGHIQDVLSLLYTHPEEVSFALSSGAEIAMQKTEDLLFFLLAFAFYMETTADARFLETDENAPAFLQQCSEALEAIQYGPHELPLLNDEKEESVWAGMLLCDALRRLIPLYAPEEGKKLKGRRKTMLAAIDRHAWDGSWYLYGWNEDAHKQGSQTCAVYKMDLLPQIWGVLCGVSRDRCTIAMENVWHMLYDRESGIIRLAAGSSVLSAQSIEQTCLAMSAFLQIGQDERAWDILHRLLPIPRSATRQSAARYRAEPYAIPGGIYTHPQQRALAGDVWKSGTAGTFLSVVIYQLLGLRKYGNSIRLCPVVPESWDSLRITYRYGSATYHLHASRDIQMCTADGEPLPDGILPLRDDGRIHEAFFPIR